MQDVKIKVAHTNLERHKRFLVNCFYMVLGTWVKSSFVVRSRPFVVSTMGKHV